MAVLIGSSGSIQVTAPIANIVTGTSGVSDEELTNAIEAHSQDSEAHADIRSAIEGTVQEADLAAVAFSGDYDDLENKPTIPDPTSQITSAISDHNSNNFSHSDIRSEILGKADASHTHTLGDISDAGTAASADIGDFATSEQGGLAESAVQPNDLAQVAFSGDYGDLENIPAINGSSTLAGLTDVDVSSDAPEHDDVLAYDSNSGKWTPATLSVNGTGTGGGGGGSKIITPTAVVVDSDVTTMEGISGAPSGSTIFILEGLAGPGLYETNGTDTLVLVDDEFAVGDLVMGGQTCASLEDLLIGQALPDRIYMRVDYMMDGDWNSFDFNPTSITLTEAYSNNLSGVGPGDTLEDALSALDQMSVSGGGGSGSDSIYVHLALSHENSTSDEIYSMLPAGFKVALLELLEIYETDGTNNLVGPISSFTTDTLVYADAGGQDIVTLTTGGTQYKRAVYIFESDGFIADGWHPFSSALATEIYLGITLSEAINVNSYETLTTALEAIDSIMVSKYALVTQQSGNYTLQPSDIGRVVEVDSEDPMTLTIPSQNEAVFPDGSQIEIYQAGVGTVTIAAGVGVTLRNAGDIPAQYGTVHLRYRGSDEWVLTGSV